MSILQNRKAKRDDGFTLMEVMIAIVILAVGLLGLAALMSQLNGTTSQSRYMGTEVVLASEKLEDINRLPNGDGNLAPGGSVLADSGPPQAKMTPGTYFDEVQISSTNGGAATTAGNAAATSSDMLVFKRRWTIEQDPVGLPPGVIRITVLVALQDGGAVSQANSFQTSMVRQWR